MKKNLCNLKNIFFLNLIIMMILIKTMKKKSKGNTIKKMAKNQTRNKLLMMMKSRKMVKTLQ